MRESRLPIAKEGYPFIFSGALATLLLALAGVFTASFFALLATAFVVNFFRDPERSPADEHSSIIAPADGKVIVVDRVFDDRFLKAEALKVSIFMNVFNVHVNRAPYPGRVDEVIYKAGAFYSADTQRSSLENESCGLVMLGEGGHRLAVVQIAGLIARRIICRVGVGDVLARGQRFGMIRFGSRVDLYLPLQTRLVVEIGQKVRAGETVLGYLS